MSLARTTKVKKDPTLNEDVVLFQRGLCWLPPINKPVNNLALASTVVSNLLQFGYSVTPEVFNAMKQTSVANLVKFNERIVDYLQEVTGGKNNYTALYPGFPQQVMDLTDAELIENAINHELTGWCPVGFDRSQVIRDDSVEPTKLKLCGSHGLDQIFTDILSVNQSITPEDTRVIEWFVKSGLPLIFPKTIPFKENLCALAGMGIPGLPVKTPTDVLRIAVYLSGGDISLPKVPAATKKVHEGFGRRKSMTVVHNSERDAFKFKKFGRKQRQYLLSLLEQTNCNPEEMILKSQRWVKLGEILHPGDYRDKYPKSFKAFFDIRNTKSVKVRSWYSQVKEAFRTAAHAGIKKLSERPGEFMRALDWMIRKFPKNLHTTLEYFQEAAKGSSNKVLYEVWQHFSKRNTPKTGRSIMIKGARKRTKLADLPAISQNVIDQVQEGVKEALFTKFSKLEHLGKVYIDPALDKIPVPTNMRSLNFSLKPRIRGQRTPFSNQSAKVVRAFFHWHDKAGNLDPDLSASFFSEDGSKQGRVSYSSMRCGKSCHSGDIIGRQGYNAEYVDIDIADAIKQGFKYVVVDVRNFRGGSLAEMEGYFGLMEREHPESNTHWKPDSLVNAHGTESTASNTLLAIVDVVAREYIFLDIDSAGATNAADDVNNLLDAVKQYSERPKFAVYDLMMLHAEARGTIVQAPEDADVKFMYDDFCNDYIKTGQYMGV